MLGCVFGTRIEWVTLENDSSGFKIQGLVSEDFQIRFVAKELRMVLDYKRDIVFLYHYRFFHAVFERWKK